HAVFTATHPAHALDVIGRPKRARYRSLSCEPPYRSSVDCQSSIVTGLWLGDTAALAAAIIASLAAMWNVCPLHSARLSESAVAPTLKNTIPLSSATLDNARQSLA